MATCSAQHPLISAILDQVRQLVFRDDGEQLGLLVERFPDVGQDMTSTGMRGWKSR